MRICVVTVSNCITKEHFLTKAKFKRDTFVCFMVYNVLWNISQTTITSNTKQK